MSDEQLDPEIVRGLSMEEIARGERSLTVQVQACRRSCYGRREWRAVAVTLTLREGAHGTILEISDGGVTGYESFYLDGMISWSDKWGSRDWVANAGTVGQ